MSSVYVSVPLVTEAFVKVYQALGGHRKKTTMEFLMQVTGKSQRSAITYMTEGHKLGYIEKSSGTEYKHSAKFLEMVKAQQVVRRLQKEFLAQHEIYRQVLVRFGNVVPDVVPLTRFLTSFGWLQSTAERQAHSIHQSFEAMKAQGCLNFDIEALKYPEDVEPIVTPDPQGSQHRSKDSGEDTGGGGSGHKSQDKGKQSHSRGGGFRGGKLDKMSVQDYNKWIDLNRRIALLEAKLNRYEAQIIGLENKIKQGTEELIYLKQERFTLEEKYK